MLDGSQESVRGRQASALRLSQVALFSKPRQHDQRLSRTHPRLAAAVLELQRLRDELDLANAARSKLHVEPASSRGFFAIDLFLCAPHGVQDAGQRIASEDRIANHFEKARDKLFTPGRRARANQGLPLPIVSLITIVVRGAVQRPNQIAVAAVRTQPQVDAIDGPFFGTLSDHLNNALCNASKELFVGDLR